MSTAVAAPAEGLPRQIPFIIGNEGCERFSFYGMRNILTQFMVTSSLLFTASAAISQAERESAAKEVFHTFVIGVYFFPLLGGWLSDRFLGKYRTILYLSLVYCLGHLFLAVFESNKAGFFAGLFLIALGSGGIKPCVSAFVGDQFTQKNKHLSKMVFDAFYWIINFGSFFASLLMPKLLKSYGPSVAFGIPGVLMLVATAVFFAGRHRYEVVPPTGATHNPNSFMRVLLTAVWHRANTATRAMMLAVVAATLICASLFLWTTTFTFVTSACLALVVLLCGTGAVAWRRLAVAEVVHGAEATQAVRAVLRVLVVFALVTPFWSLFDQKASTWVLQAGSMQKPTWFEPSQMQALNPLLVMLLIPFNNVILYPALRRAGVEVTALRRMAVGIAFSALAWFVVGGFQLMLDAGTTLSITAQILPYALLTFGEVLVSATGLEFAYSQAPQSMKSVLMSFWSLSVTIGNLWVLLAGASIKHPRVLAAAEGLGMSGTAFLMFFFALFACAAALAFAAYAKRYTVVDHYRA